MVGPQDGGVIRLRPLVAGDWGLVRRWLAMPEVQRWWGNLASAEAEIRLVYETPSAISRIIEADGEPVGYAHAIDATYWGASLPDGMPAGTWDADLFIAAPEHRGQGAGQRAVKLLAEEVFSTTLAVALSVFVSIRNEAAVRAYEKAGFRWGCVWDDPVVGPSWLLLLDRPPTSSA